MRVMITGAAGFIGGFLAEHCVRAGCSVLGIDLGEQVDARADIDFERCDVRDFGRLSELIRRFRPHCIFHLAAQSYPTVSLSQPRETFDINVGGTINLFECLRASALMPTVVVACSSAEYGPVAGHDLPVRENHALSPLHPYGVSKVAQDLLAAQYFANFAIPALRIRIFNTTGPGKVGDVCSDLTRRAVEIEVGSRPPSLRVGNLKNRRAILDVRDFVRALWLASQHGTAGEVYNIGADQTYSVEELIEMIQKQLNVSFQVEQDPLLMRSCDEPIIVGDNSRFRNCYPWTPDIALSTTLRDMLSWWRSHLSVPVPPQQVMAAGSHVDPGL